jgi:hypothetical protein
MYRKSFIYWALISIASLSPLAEAQRAEVSIDYSYINYNPAKSLAGAVNLNGGGGAFVYNFRKFIGFKAELNGYGTANYTFTIPVNNPHGLPPGVYQSSGSAFTYLFGPQINIPVHKLRPFGEALFGGAYNNVYANLYTRTGILSAKPSNNGFAMAIGGGLDIPVGERVMIRPAELNYFLTRYQVNGLGTNNQSNFRYQAGVVFVF